MLTLTGAFLSSGAGKVYAQKTGGGGSPGGGGSLGGSFGSSGGSTGGASSLGGSASSSSPFGGATGTTGSRTTGGTSTSSNVQYGQGSPLAGYYYSPLSFGLAGNVSSIGGTTTGTSGGTSGGISSGGANSRGSALGGASNSGTSNTSKAAASTVKFGQAMYNVNPVSTFNPTSTNSGTASIRSQNQAGAQQTTTPQTTIRPSYAARIAFTPVPVPVNQVVVDFKQAVAESQDLSKPNNQVQLVVDGEIVVLRGVVQTERDSILAEALARMTPGVRGVRNELAVRDTSPDAMASR
jgi:hypothetical protein